MGVPVKANILKTGATLYFAPLGTALPPITTLGAGVAWPAPWARLGFTAEAVKLTYADERALISVEEMLAPVEDWRSAEELSLETKLSELTADYLQLLTGGVVTTVAAASGTAGYEQLDIGGVPRVTQYAVGFEGVRYDAASNALPVRCFIPIASFQKNGEIEFSRKGDGYATLGIKITGFGDTANAGRILKWQRATAPAL